MQRRDYGDAWAAIMQLVRRGSSWSGRERNVCFLNTRDGRFANVSHVSGLDSAADGRAFASVDWDADGDLDLWFRDRTAPRLRLLINTTRAGVAGRFVELRLEGTSSNRDAVGAVAELLLNGEKDRDGSVVRRKTVRAGDLFLSQSSKWLHFGLGRDVEPGAKLSVEVAWPGGSRERFADVVVDRRYRLRQGTAQAVAASVESRSWSEKAKAGVDSRVAKLPVGASARVVLPARTPFPLPPVRKASGEAPKARAIVLWSSDCAHCRQELLAFDLASEKIRQRRIDLLLLSLDALDPAEAKGEGSAARRALAWVDKHTPNLSTSFLDARSYGFLQAFEAALFDVEIPASVPRTYLLDEVGDLLAIYRGIVKPETLISDADLLGPADADTQHHLSAPMPGAWLTRAVPRVDVAEFLARELEERFPEESLRYFEIAFEEASGGRRANIREAIVQRCRQLADQHRERRDAAGAAFFFELALRVSDEDAAIHCEYAELLASFGVWDRAQAEFERALDLDRDLERARRGLARVRELRASESGR